MPHLGGLLIRLSAVDALEKSDDEKDAVKAAAPTGTTVKIDFTGQSPLSPAHKASN